MKVIAAIHADFEQSPIGTQSRLAADLCGIAVLTRTLTRVQAVAGLHSVHLLVPSAQKAQLEPLLHGLQVRVHAGDWQPPAHQQLVTTGRKWALDNWRGGVGGMCAFDESIHPAVLCRLAAELGADGVMVVPAHAVLFNPPIAEKMLERFQRVHEDLKLVFAQSPPGLTGIILATDLLADFAKTGYPPGTLLAYSPAEPRADLVGKECCLQTPTEVASVAGRLLADTAESFATCEAILKALDPGGIDDPVAVCRFLAAYRQDRVPPLPAEVEVELTTQDPLPETKLRPRGHRVPSRGPLDLQLLGRLARQLAERDDARIVLAGFGDPLCHPQWQEAVAAVKQAGLYGVSIHTTGPGLAKVGPEAILAAAPDLLVVWLDAAGPDVYRQVHGRDGYEQAAAAVLAVEQARRQRRQVQPLVVPAMTKATINAADLEKFFDSWIKEVGSCYIEGYSDRAGQVESLQIASMAPPARTRCSRLRSRLLVLADGRAVSCDQDFKALQVVGDSTRQSLREIWLGEPMQRLREFIPAAQTGGEVDKGSPDGLPVLCQRCDEWARP